MRHRIDRSDLAKKHAAHVVDYLPHIDSHLIQEFCMVRNTLAHYWGIPFDNGQWPRDQLMTTKAYAWPYHEPKYKGYTGWTPVPEILNDHFQALIKAQDAVFGLLVNDIGKFETDNGVIIA